MLNYCLIEFYSLVKGLKQPQGTNLCGFYICEYIRWATSERRPNANQFDVRKQYSHFYFITINCVEFHSTYIYISILISFLKMYDMREKLLPDQHVRAIQEELAGFLLREVLDPAGHHYAEDEELNM